MRAFSPAFISVRLAMTASNWESAWPIMLKPMRSSASMAMMTTDDDDTKRGKSVQAVGNNGPHLFTACAVVRNSGVKGRHLALVAIVVALSSAAVAVVLTPSSGILSAPVVARASFADQTDIKFKIKGQGREVINVNNAGDMVMQQSSSRPADIPAGTAIRDQWSC
jgi:hypothetical protein